MIVVNKVFSPAAKSSCISLTNNCHCLTMKQVPAFLYLWEGAPKKHIFQTCMKRYEMMPLIDSFIEDFWLLVLSKGILKKQQEPHLPGFCFTSYLLVPLTLLFDVTVFLLIMTSFIFILYFCICFYFVLLHHFLLPFLPTNPSNILLPALL